MQRSGPAVGLKPFGHPIPVGQSATVVHVVRPVAGLYATVASQTVLCDISIWVPAAQCSEAGRAMVGPPRGARLAMAPDPSHSDLPRLQESAEQTPVKATRSLRALLALLGPPLSSGEWILIVGVLAYVAVNFFLWSLPMTQFQLFCISVPLGLCAFLAILWYVGRR
jgi:hypothetical protein